VQQGKQVSKKNREGDNQRPFLRTKNVFWGRLYLSELDEMHFSEADEKRLELKTGDLLICEGGDIGRTAIWQNGVERCYYQNHLHRARLRNAESADPQFVLYWLWYAFQFGKLYFGRGNVTTIPNLSQSKLRELPLAIPPLPEQKKIAHILSTVQRAIEEQERIIQTTTELKKALMQKLFIEGLRGEPQKETEIGLVPESWDVVPLGECAIVQTGIAKGRKIPPEEAIELPYLRVANVQDGYLALAEMKSITLRKGEQGRYALKKGDVVLTEGGDLDKLGRGFIWQGEIDNCVHQNHIFAVRPDTIRLLSEFFAYQSQSHYGKQYFLSVAHKTTNLACINTTKLKAFPVRLPPMSEQQEIVEAGSSIDKKIQAARCRNDALESLFRTLLHELMTAKTQVAELEFRA
jgi:type I restriction enzyme S subunit